MARDEDIYSRIKQRGIAAIDEFILTHSSEELFLDFKRSGNNGDGNRLHDRDRENLAKAISGFGNSEGGVIVWGVDCSNTADNEDIAHSIFPIKNPARFKSWIENAVSGCTIPPNEKVEVHSVPIGAGEDGFVIVWIPKSLFPPHQVVGKTQYYMRAGSNFYPVPHAVLAGLFGKRPSPNIIHNYMIEPFKFDNGKVEITFGLDLRNSGIGIAKYVYLNIWIWSKPGPNCRIEFQRKDERNFSGQFSYGINWHAISNEDARLAPDAHFSPVYMIIHLAPPFEKNLNMRFSYGCEGGIPSEYKVENDRQFVDDLYQTFRAGNVADTIDKHLTDKFFNTSL